MSRRKKIQEEIEEQIEEAEVVMRWSPKRIALATFLVVMIIAGGIYAISLMSENRSSVLGERVPNKPQIDLPNEKTVEEIIDRAQKDLSNINTKNIISSQPKLQQIINDLTSLTESSSSAKDLICNTVCR